MYEVFEYLLQSRGLTAYKVSKDTGIPQTTFSTWKSKKHILNADALNILAKYLNVSVEYLITGEENETSDNKYEAKNSTEREMLLLCRSMESVSDEERESLINNFKNSIDIFLKAKGIK